MSGRHEPGDVQVHGHSPTQLSAADAARLDRLARLEAAAGALLADYGDEAYTPALPASLVCHLRELSDALGRRA